MYEFRDHTVKEFGCELLVHRNPEGVAMGINPFVHGSAKHTDIMKTEGLKQALNKYGFDAAFGGARRDEEKSRAKERIYSFRDRFHRWDPKNHVLSCGTTTTARLTKAKASAYSHCPTGPSWISGNIFSSRKLRLFRCIWRSHAR